MSGSASEKGTGSDLLLIGLLATSGSEGPVFLSLRLELGLDSIFRLL